MKVKLFKIQDLTLSLNIPFAHLVFFLLGFDLDYMVRFYGLVFRKGIGGWNENTVQPERVVIKYSFLAGLQQALWKKMAKRSFHEKR